MPIYEYQCRKCRKHHEIMQKITDKPLSVCPSCGGEMKKIISNTSFVLKGTGWYATDYASGKNNSASRTADTKGTESKTETKPESKPVTRAEKKPETKKSPSST